MSREAVRGWLAARRPEAPAVLVERLYRFVDGIGEDRLSGSVTHAMAELGLFALDAVQAGDGTGDDIALDLLAADAFVTYAFEAAALEGLDVAPVAERLIRGAEARSAGPAAGSGA